LFQRAVSEPPSGIDARVARRRFDRAASTYAAASRLEAEVGMRMLERLEYLKIAPRTILDAGSGPSREAKNLARRYAKSDLVALDFSLAMLKAGDARLGLFKKKLLVCGDLARLPLRAAAVDFIWCNMALHWTGDPLAAIKEFGRVLSPGGLLMFSTLGPDTLKELRVAAGAARVHRFVDMHDLGDMLVEAGFAAPVMDMELLRLNYADARVLLADLRSGGQTNARPDRPRGLARKDFGRQLHAALRVDARVAFAATYEVVYGHGWKGTPRKLADGRDIVEFRPRSLR
jgi:malonyl-CoA O-methyltransferase